MRLFDTLVEASGTSFSIFRAGRKLTTVKGIYIDTDKFNELLVALEHCSDNGNYERTSLAKFTKLLQENSWLMSPVATYILNHLLG